MTHWTYERLLQAGFEYLNDFQTNLKKVLAFLDPNDSEEYYNWEMCHHYSRTEKRSMNCVCGQNISMQFYVRHKETRDLLDIGSSCINHFPIEFQMVRDKILKKIKNPNIKFCKRCDKVVRRDVVEQYNHLKSIQDIFCKKCLKIVESEKKYKIDILNTKIKWGKYKGLTLKEINTHNRNYLIWLSDKCYDPILKKKINYIIQLK